MYRVVNISNPDLIRHMLYQHFEILSDAEKSNIVMSSVFVKHTAEYLYKAYYKRRSLIYN